MLTLQSDFAKDDENGEVRVRVFIASPSPAARRRSANRATQQPTAAGFAGDAPGFSPPPLFFSDRRGLIAPLLLNRRYQQADQDRNDGDDHESRRAVLRFREVSRAEDHRPV